MQRNWLSSLRRARGGSARETPVAQQVDANLAIAVEHHELRTRVALSGELDLSNACALRSQLLCEEKARPEVIEIDLRGLTFIDSSGLSELFAVNRRVRERNGRVVLIKDHGPIEHVLNLARVEDVIDVVEQPAG